MGMTIDNVLEILEKHKLHIPSNVFYELKADIVNFEEPITKNDAPENNVGNIEPTTKNDLGVDSLFAEFKEKLSRWLYHNSESVCGNNMIDIDYLEGHIDEILYEMGIIGEVGE